MPTVRVTVPLPYYLRLAEPLSLRYADVCTENSLPELIDGLVRVSFEERTWTNERSGLSFPRSTILFEVDVEAEFEITSINRFAILNCREILERVIRTFVAVTGETQNAGFIGPLGTADFQLSAEIALDGADQRDRWPDASFTNLPLSAPQLDEFNACMAGEMPLPTDRLFLARATMSQERGDYASAVVQAATAVELRTTTIVLGKLDEAGWSESAQRPYERSTLGRKLEIPATDPRSLATYFPDTNGFDAALRDAKGELVPLRNRVAHRGFLPQRAESLSAVRIADKFLLVVAMP